MAQEMVGIRIALKVRTSPQFLRQNMFVIPVAFAKEHEQMLAYCKEMLCYVVSMGLGLCHLAEPTISMRADLA